MNSVLYYDGKVSDPHRVFLEVGERGFSLLREKGKPIRQFRYTDIEHLDKLGDKYQLELKPLITREAAELLQFDDAELYQKLLRNWRMYTSSIKRAIHFFDTQSLFGKILITLSIGGVFLWLLFLSFSNIHRLIPVKYDLYLGEKIEKRLLAKLELCTSDSLMDFVKKAEESLKKPEDHFDVSIHLVNHPLVNAVAFPGGKIFLFRGLVEASGSPDEVLGVLAHEMEHGEQRHGIKQMSRSLGFAFMASMVIGIAVEGVEIFEGAEIVAEIASTLLYLKYSRGFETEADLLAVKRLQEKQISVKGMSAFFKRLDSLSRDRDKKKDKNRKKAMEKGGDSKTKSREEEGSLSSWFQTHPKSKKRFEYIKRAAEAENFSPSPLFQLERENWERIKRSCPESKEPIKLWKWVL